MNILFSNKVLVSALSIAFISLLTCSPKKVFAQEYSGCFMTDKTGRYIDLSSVCNGGKPDTLSLKSKLFLSIKKLGVSIAHESCEPGVLGFYKPGKNKMVLCQNNIESEDSYLETLAHESWHVVQDCVGGLNNNETVPVTVGNPSWFRAMVNNLNYSDLKNLSLYKAEDLTIEVEAFAMEKHPDLVIKGLDACASRPLAQN